MRLTKYKQEISSITKMEDCIGTNIPSLSMLKKQFGEEDTLKAVGKKIKQVNDYFNLQKKMTPEQMWMTAKLILKEYYFLNLADMKLVFENMLSLKYGQHYGKIDGGDFLEAFRQYTESRIEVAEHLSTHKHSKTKDKREEGAQTIKERWLEIKK